MGNLEVNLAHVLDAVEGIDETVALIHSSNTTTYAELRRLVAGARGGLRELGVGPGDSVALVCANGRPFVVGYLAALGLGAVAVPLNPTSPASELQQQLAAVSAKAVIVDRSATAAWSHVDRAAVPSVQAVVAVDGAVIEGRTLAEAEPVDVVEVESSHPAVLMFTSGTAGAPRAAILTHGSMLANIDQLRSASDSLHVGDVLYGVIPLFHVFGLNVVLGAALHAGATLLLVQRFDPITAVESIRARGVTVIPGAPAMWSAFSQLDEIPADAFAGVRRAYSGAAKLSVGVMERMRERFGLVVREGYGLTEASPAVTTSVDIDPKPGSVGVLLPGMELRVVDDSGVDVLVGDAGEIWLRGPNLFAGYLDDPATTARVLGSDGWLRTGDIGYLDEDGYLFLVDRAKDLVIVSGFNVFPAEVEDVLLGAPGVADAGVVGVPHPHTGEAVRAFVVPQPGALLDEEGLIDFCADHLARYKCPSKVLLVDELPRNVNGKLLRRSLT